MKHSFIHTSNYLLSTYYVLDVLPGTGVIAVNKMSKFPVACYLYSSGEMYKKENKLNLMEMIGQSNAEMRGKWGTALHRVSSLRLLKLSKLISK